MKKNKFEVFFVDGEEALVEVKRLVPEVKEFDTAFLEQLTEEEQRQIRREFECDKMAMLVFCSQGLRRVRSFGPVWIRVDKNEPKEGSGVTAVDGKLTTAERYQFVEDITNRQWALQRKIGDGALCGSSVLTFLPDSVWACQTGERGNWFAIRDKQGPSMQMGVFDDRFAETRQIES